MHKLRSKSHHPPTRKTTMSLHPPLPHDRFILGRHPCTNVSKLMTSLMRHSFYSTVPKSMWSTIKGKHPCYWPSRNGQKLPLDLRRPVLQQSNSNLRSWSDCYCKREPIHTRPHTMDGRHRLWRTIIMTKRRNSCNYFKTEAMALDPLPPTHHPTSSSSLVQRSCRLTFDRRLIRILYHTTNPRDTIPSSRARCYDLSK